MYIYFILVSEEFQFGPLKLVFFHVYAGCHRIYFLFILFLPDLITSYKVFHIIKHIP